MASDQKTVDYITEQMSTAGHIRSRKMFGEYAIYCDDKVIALVCDNQLFLKITEPGRTIVRSQTLAPPYPGAKDSFLIDNEDWDDARYLSQLVRVTADALPVPKKK
ncbi:MAG TPA: TfoX/Sxy family protein [Nevskiaceae bacterium]|nr:TfoX/Sxy family protein [Nevskiaceae bacterium]